MMQPIGDNTPPSLYSHRIHEYEETNYSKIGSEINSKSNLKTAQAPNAVDKLSQFCITLNSREKPVDHHGGLSTTEMSCQQTQQTVAHVVASTYPLRTNFIFWISLMSLKKKTLLIRFYPLTP